MFVRDYFYYGTKRDKSGSEVVCFSGRLSYRSIFALSAVELETHIEDRVEQDLGSDGNEVIIHSLTRTR